MSCSLFTRMLNSLPGRIIQAWPTDAILRKPGALDANIVLSLEAPILPEDEIPGSTQGVTNLQAFVDYATMVPKPDQGDEIQINGVWYEILRIEAPLEGGTLFLKRTY